MSHELRTPLNSSLILAKLLSENKEGNLTAEQLKFAQTIYGAGNDLLNLINDILDLSKVEAGRLELQPQFVSVHRLVDSLQRTFTPLAGEKKLAFEVQVEPDAPDVDGDRQPARRADPQEPAVQRDQVHRDRQRHDQRAGAAGRPRRVRGQGLRHRHPRGPAGHHLRGLPPGRRHHQPALRRHGPGAVDLARAGAPAGRHDRGGERRGPGQHLHADAAGQVDGRARDGRRRGDRRAASHADSPRRPVAVRARERAHARGPRPRASRPRRAANALARRAGAASPTTATTRRPRRAACCWWWRTTRPSPACSTTSRTRCAIAASWRPPPARRWSSPPATCPARSCWTCACPTAPA